MNTLKIVLAVLLFVLPVFAEDALGWVRIKFKQAQDSEDQWDVDLNYDALMLAELKKLTTMKINTKVHTASLTKFDVITKYPVLFMHGSGTPLLNEEEKKNLKEYMQRGGFVLIDDCHTKEFKAIFYKSMRKILTEELFPGKKAEILTPDHEIFHSQFDLPKGIPGRTPMNQPPLGIHDEKGRLMALILAADIHCAWGAPNKVNDPDVIRFKKDSYRMIANVMIYTMTH